MGRRIPARNFQGTLLLQDHRPRHFHSVHNSSDNSSHTDSRDKLWMIYVRYQGKKKTFIKEID